MQSIGGSWGAGTSIYDAIASCKSYVTIVVYGQAESMSGVILQAADNRLMSPSSHSKCVNGKFFQERGYNLSKTKSYIKRRMKDGDWYLNSHEAVQFGFVDGILDDK